MLPLLLSLA